MCGLTRRAVVACPHRHHLNRAWALTQCWAHQRRGREGVVGHVDQWQHRRGSVWARHAERAGRRAGLGQGPTLVQIST
jgi:hypothetical protein